jgi:hypothetical protein
MKKLSILLLLSVSDIAHAQSPTLVDDVKSVDNIIAALYDVISGDAGTPRNWERFAHLFIQEAHLIPTSKDKEGKIGYRIITPDEYVELFSTRITTGFFERELHRETESYGAIVHVFSTYETKEKKDGPVTNRGINSIQLFFDGNRYFVTNIFWSAESMGFPLPEKYLMK